MIRLPSLLLIASALLAAEAQAPQGPEPLRLMATSVAVNRTDTVVTTPRSSYTSHSSRTLEVEAHLPPGLIVIRVDQVTVTAASDGDWKPLPHLPSAEGNSFDDTGVIKLNLDASGLPARLERLGRLELSADVLVSPAGARRAGFGPLKDMLGKRFAIAGYPGASLDIIDLNREALTVDASAELQAVITAFEVRSARNEEINTNNENSPTGEGRTAYTLQAVIPDDARLLLHLRQPATLRRLTVLAEGIALVPPTHERAADATVQTEDAPDQDDAVKATELPIPLEQPVP